MMNLAQKFSRVENFPLKPFHILEFPLVNFSPWTKLIPVEWVFEFVLHSLIQK